MKITVIFSSLTGNTKKVAYEILKEMPKNTKIYDLKELNHEIEEKFLVLAYWVDRAKPNKEMLEFMNNLEGKTIVTFGTLGANPNSEHGNITKNNVNEILQKNNIVLGNFLCQGKIDPKITEMFKKMGSKVPHVMTEERLKRHEEALKHPNEEDFKAARDFIKAALDKYSKGEY